MFSENRATKNLSDFLRYLAQIPDGDDARLPSLQAIARELGISIASLREQLEVARIMGLVEIKPKTGLRKLKYSLSPILKHSLTYGISTNDILFNEYSDLRNHIEAAYWMQAVQLLNEEDHTHLKELLINAKVKLNNTPVQIPHIEHRELHLSIYRKLPNIFVKDLLEVYWDLYEEVGLNQFKDLTYLEAVWNYHEKMVESICAGQLETGYRALLDHMELISRRATKKPSGNFE